MIPDNQPLSGLTVLDLSHVYAGPYTTLLLAMAGARVLKIEPPDGEHLRRRAVLPGPRYAFTLMNSNKESVTLDLKHPEGVQAFIDLARHADVLVENFTPGVLDRLGLSWSVLREVNPRLIYATLSGYGSTGRYATRAAMDLSVQAMSGAVAATGFPDGPPVKAGVALCDFSAGVHLYGAITTALFQRERTGRGKHCEVSMLESVFPMLMSSLTRYYATGEDGPRAGNRHPGLSVAPYAIFEANDGHVVVICESDHHWRLLCDAMGRPDLRSDPRYADTASRVGRMDEVDHIVAEWCAGLTKDEVVARLDAVGVPSAPVREMSEVLLDPHLYERNYLQRIEHPDLGPVTAMGSALRFDNLASPDVTPSHQLGADTRRALVEIAGYDEERVSRLADSGALGNAQ